MRQRPLSPWMLPERPLDPPEYPPTPCPVCGEDCEDIYLDQTGKAVGCEYCISKVTYEEWEERYK